MIKKLLLPLLLAAVLLPAPLRAAPDRDLVRLTRYEDLPIHGVSAGSLFNVELVKSNATKAVVELDTDLERYLRFERRPDGIVSVRLVIPKEDERRIFRLNGWRGRTLKLTLYLPELTSVSLEDMARLQTNDRFGGGTVRIEAEDMAKIIRLSLEADDVTVKASDMASADLSLLTRKACAKAEDMAKITLRGSAEEIRAESSDMAGVNGREFDVRRAELKASDMAKTSIRGASDYLHARASDMASVSYSGEPRQIDLKTPRRTIYRKNE